MRKISIEERAVALAHYIIDSKDTVRGTAVSYTHLDVYKRQQ